VAAARAELQAQPLVAEDLGDEGGEDGDEDEDEDEDEDGDGEEAGGGDSEKDN
jgi:hypothetical protein